MPINIDYTTIDFDALKNELVGYLKETNSFKDIDYVGSNINSMVQLYAYLGSLFGYYINSVANEPFLPSAKRYKNLNRIARLLSYNPRGNKSSKINLVGSLLPEYCFGKEDSYFEIPAYSIFPSNKNTPEGEQFNFTNENQLVYFVKSFGVRTVDQSDFAYDGNVLPLTKPASYWNIDTPNTNKFDPSKIALKLSDTKPLSIMDRLDTSNYKKFDIENVPLFDSADSSSVGQPFNRNIATNLGNLSIVPDVTYFIVFNYDTQTSTPYLELMVDGVALQEKSDDIIASIRLEKEDINGTYYTLKQIQNNSKNRFYVGILGQKNVEALSFEYDKLESTVNGIKQVHMHINKSGDMSPYQVLVDGITYTFRQGKISSQIFEVNTWDATQPYYNINLNIISPDKPEYNFDSTLTIESKSPGTNSVTIARIYPNYVDQSTNIKAISKDVGQRYGNIQAIPKSLVTTTEQKSGIVSVIDGVTKIFVPFETEFEAILGDPSDYILSLTPSENVQVWYSDKSDTGFNINIESNTGFAGDINWVATRFYADATKTQTVVFDVPIPDIDGAETDYTIFLTPSDNVNVWYTDKTKYGFKINTEKSYSGAVSYSTYVFSKNNAVVKEINFATQRKGTATITDSTLSKDITFDSAFADTKYGLHMLSNKNLNVWYTNKTTSGFTINVEPGFIGHVVVDWFADYSPEYVYQKHGVINFSGQETGAGNIPGIRFNNISETFIIQDVIQGTIKFSYINKNGVIDTANNYLNMQYAADRRTVNEVKLQIQNQSISYEDLRIFVKNVDDVWEEWHNAYDLSITSAIKAGEKVYFVRIDEYKNIEISFGDGIKLGTSPSNKEIIIFGLECVGKYGNIPPNSISSNIILSKNILGDDNITIDFEDQFIQLIGLKSRTYYSSSEITDPTSIYDSEGTNITERELLIRQPTPAFGGDVIETVEELRANAGLANLRQDRVVSKEDYISFCNEVFHDYIMKTKVLSYKEMVDSGILPPGEEAKYWFNHIFLVTLPTYGKELTKLHKDHILSVLNKKFKSMSTVEHELVTAKFMPIDVRVRYKKAKIGGSNDTIETKIRNIIRNYFDKENRNMGDTIEYGPIEKEILNIPNLQSAEMAFFKDPDNKFGKNDYITDGVPNINETIQDVKRRKVMELLAKDPSLLNIIDPLFNVRDPVTNKKSWVFSANIELNKFEFPVVGDIIIEAEE